MNTETTKENAALDAGYSPSMARVPAQIEQSKGFHLAMATLASQTGNIAMKVLHELGGRDMTKQSTNDLLHAVTVLSNAWDKFVPKNKAGNEQDNDLRTVFAQVIDISASNDTDSARL